MKTNDFFDFYKDKTKDKTTVNKIGRFLTKLDIKPVKMSNNAGYKYIKTSKELLDTFQKLNFMDDTVDHISNNDPEPETEIENIYKSKYEDLLKKFQDLERQLKKQAKKECLTLTKKEINKEPEEEEVVNDLDVIVDIMLQ